MVRPVFFRDALRRMISLMALMPLPFHAVVNGEVRRPFAIAPDVTRRRTREPRAKAVRAEARRSPHAVVDHDQAGRHLGLGGHAPKIGGRIWHAREQQRLLFGHDVVVSNIPRRALQSSLPRER